DAVSLPDRHPGLGSRRPGGYVGGTSEHRRPANARQWHDAAALDSASWGLSQVMGYHWQALGYDSAQDFAERMARHEAEHLEAYVRFIEADPALHKALKGRKWAEFARRYNGPAYARNLYDVKLARAFEQFSDVLQAAA